MADKPLIFSALMIRALLAGRKAQTRRLLKVEPECIDSLPSEEQESHELENRLFGQDGAWIITAKPVRYAVGDRLWVREQCRARELIDGRDGVQFRADETWLPIGDTVEAAGAWLAMFTYRQGNDSRRDRRGEVGVWVPSIHMPRWASRLTLTVTAVKVERLQDISNVDAIDEGAMLVNLPVHGASERSGRPPLGANPRQRFAVLWDSLHGHDAWSANPWVAAISFSTERRNTDAAASVGAAA